MFASVASSPQALAVGCLLNAGPASAHGSTWERAGCPLGRACPKAVPDCRLASTGIAHDIVFNDVKKCTYLGSLTLAPTLLER